MLRKLVRVKLVERKVTDAYGRLGTFTRKVEEAPVLQWQDVEDDWHDVETVMEEVVDG